MLQIKGSIILDALFGMIVLSLITALLYSASRLKHKFRFENESEKMRYIWESEEALETCFPARKSVLEDLLEISGSMPVNPSEEAQDLPLLN